MEIFIPVLLMFLGFLILIKSSDVFVDAISSIAVNFRMSKMMIALTVAAFGTCAPELAISFNSISSQQGEIALSNVIGSNVVNILLIIGLAAFICPIRVKNVVTKKELPILVGITSTFTICTTIHYLKANYNFILNRFDAVLFIIYFIIFISYIISVIRSKQGVFERSSAKYKLLTSIILSIVCCALIIVASDLVVDNAVKLASVFNVSQKLITMTIVVIGTSLPELTMTVVAAKKGEFDIALGNIIGTNIFNIGIVLGVPLLIYGGFGTNSFNLIDILAVEVAVVVLYLFAKNDKVLSRLEGSIMIGLFLMYYVYLFF